MSRIPTTPDRLAMEQNSGRATAFQRNRLAEIILEYATQTARSAASRKQIRWSDCDDVAQDAAIKTLKKLPRYNFEKAGLKTFTAMITRNVIGDLRRKYAFEAQYFVDSVDIEGAEK